MSISAQSSAASGGNYNLFNLIEDGMSRRVRTLIVLYVLIYRILTPPIAALISNEIPELFGLRVITNSLFELATIIPVIFFRKVGYFHPLVFPVLYGIAFNVAFQPITIFLPFLLSGEPWFTESPSWSILLSSLTPTDYSVVYSYYNVVGILYWLSLYAGFFYSRGKEPLASTRSDRIGVPGGAMIFLTLAILSGWIFIASRGGIEAQILSFYTGRYKTLSGSGVFTVITKVASVAVLMWMASSSKSGRKPIFWIYVSLLLPIYWLVDGSRSSTLLMIMAMIIVASMKRGAIPYYAASMAAVIALTLFGLLGLLRQDYHATSVDLEVFSADRAGEWLEASTEETKKRASEEGNLAAFVAGIETDRLYGSSYLSVLAYPIPRAIWADKPKNIFTYNTWVAFMGHSSEDQAPSVWGIPTNSISEAYWNFGLLGVIFVGAFVGTGLRFALRLFKRNPYQPWACVFYLEFLLYFNGNSRWALYLIQNLVGLVIVVILAKILSNYFSRPTRRVTYDSASQGAS